MNIQTDDPGQIDITDRRPHQIEITNADGAVLFRLRGAVLRDVDRISTNRWGLYEFELVKSETSPEERPGCRRRIR